MRVAVFGNNLNFGYFLTRLLRGHVESAILLLTDYAPGQEQHEWWTNRRAEDLVRYFPRPPLGRPGSLRRYPGVRALYHEAAKYDVLLLSEDGPALFSELHGPRKVLVSYGYDLQVLPFCHEHYLADADAPRKLTDVFKLLARGRLSLVNHMRTWLDGLMKRQIQARQRAGIRQCDRLVCNPQQQHLVDALGIEPERCRFVPLPMDCEVLQEIDPRDCTELQAQYSRFDLVFFHPTRQFYLPRGANVFLKDNDQLLRGFREFLQHTDRRVRLLLIRKGGEGDIAATERLLRELGIEHQVEWLPEMPNKRLRAYYTLPNVVVCDQFSRHIAMLGNTGREASYFGRPLVTAFRSWNSRYYGEDFPPHVFPAETAKEVATALQRIASFSIEERGKIEELGRQWFQRWHAAEAILPAWVELLKEVVAAGAAPCEPAEVRR